MSKAHCELYDEKDTCDEVELTYGGEILTCSKCKFYTLKDHDAKIRSNERAKVLEIVKEAKEDCLHHFQDINFYYNDCRMKDDLEGFWNCVIEELKEQGNER